MTLASRLGSLLGAVENCVKQGNDDWQERHTATLQALVKQHMPSGSGFDAGTTLDWAKSNAEKLVFLVAYHHMNDAGYYDGWTEHKVIVRPSLAYGLNVKIVGSDRNQIKEYIHEAFFTALSAEVPL